jgi:hypothetical protein
VATSEALDLLYLAMHVVLYRCTAAAIKMASIVGAFLDCCCVSCCPGSRQGNMEQVVAQWWHLKATGVALDMVHQGIQAALH